MMGNATVQGVNGSKDIRHFEVGAVVVGGKRVEVRGAGSLLCSEMLK